jgi:hypothetical protein
MKKQVKVKQPKQPLDWSWLVGILTLVLAFAEVVATYVFATQDNKVLWGVGTVLGIHAAILFARAFIFRTKV